MQPSTSCPKTLKTAFLLALCLAPAAVFAQSSREPSIDIAAGYERLHGVRSDGDFAPGVFVAIEGNYHEWLAVVGRFSGTTSSEPARFFGDTAAGTGGFLAGARLSLPGAHHVVPFAEMLAGIMQFGDHGSVYPAFAFHPGVGVDLAVHRRVKLRLAAGYRCLLGIQAASGATASLTAISAGVVVQ